VAVACSVEVKIKMNAIPRELLRESEIVGALEQICQALELTPSQHEEAKRRYEAVGAWLGQSEDLLLAQLTIYPHGSVALGTTVKPHSRFEHDVDLVRVASRNFVTNCLISDVTGKLFCIPLPI